MMSLDPPSQPRVGSLPDKATGHVAALDGLRGLAILLVLLLHFSVYGHGLARADVFIDRLYYRIAGAGWIGVDLFFVLSGFLITGILIDAKGFPNYLRNFYARRVLRIFPLYYGALVLLMVVLPRLWPYHAGLQSLAADGAWYWAYLSNVKIARDGWPEVGAIGHFWSLAVEEQFYLLWPVIVLAVNRRQLQIVCLLCVIMALAVRVLLNARGNSPAAFVLTPARMDALAVGALIAVAARRADELRRFARLARSMTILLGLSALLIFVLRKGFAGYDPVVSTIGHTIIAFFFGAVLVLALTLPPGSFVVRALESSILRFFGRYSYGLYVLHHPILFLGAGIVPLALIPTVLGSQLLRQFVFIVIATSVSVVLAFLSWHLFEKWFLMLKDRFPYHPPIPAVTPDAEKGLLSDSAKQSG